MAEQNEKFDLDRLTQALKDGATVFINTRDFAKTREAILDRGCDYATVQTQVRPCRYLEPGTIVACELPPPAEGCNWTARFINDREADKL